MVSGKYSALTGAVAREQNLDNISANLANVNTIGYKRAKVTFESLLKGARQIKQAHGINYTRVRDNFTDLSAGPYEKTDAPLDLAIHGTGFFKLQGPDGIRYTRKGDFTLDADGRLLTTTGMPVLDDSNTPITIPNTNTNRISISSLGMISVIDGTGAQTEVGRIGVVAIDDPLKLKRESDTTFSLKTGGQEIPIDQPVVIQGSVEHSNVNMVAEMTNMINNERDFDTYNKMLKSYAAIDAKQDDLGTLS